MKATIIKLTKGQFLKDIEPFKSSGIPNNCILHKEITGCGATSSELFTERNSIIIVPHVPVIKAKQRAHNDKYGAEAQILGIYKGVDDIQIENYLNSKAIYKKLITTPEGFKKILRVFTNDIESLLKEYFLLFDECERIITDVSYRGAITAPIEWFIKFENKALVSATPLDFSHPVLASMNHYKILPEYDYRKQIKVIGTNNIIESLERQLPEEPEKPVFLFINSTNCIIDIVNTLNLKDRSYVYCGDKSVAKLTANKFRRASSELDLSNLSKYNFLTSRYFSALDIELDYQPDVVLVTDVHTAEHSILDVHTEIIQIAGRFRRGINGITLSQTSILNLNQKLLKNPSIT
ncbi:MAG: hypothetical protein AAGC65_12435 [Mucilaginibacter sp.]|uniref:hypothetical protein n=1 Tax=Mucilaginibacter sp. TaxID=1882438 RepID=UPI0031AFB96D